MEEIKKAKELVKDFLSELDIVQTNLKANQVTLKNKRDARDENETFLSDNGIQVSTQIPFYVAINDAQEHIGILYATALDSVVKKMVELKTIIGEISKQIPNEKKPDKKPKTTSPDNKFEDKSTSPK